MGLVYITILSIVPAPRDPLFDPQGKAFNIPPPTRTACWINFLLPLGEKGAELTHQLMGFVENVQGNVLAGIGLVMLFVTTMSMAQKVEDSFNFVWRVDQPRGLAQRLSEYLSLILIVPIVMVTAADADREPSKATHYVQRIRRIFSLSARLLLLIGKMAPYFTRRSWDLRCVYWFLAQYSPSS